MQIDFHFGCVYLLARCAGFQEDAAKIIAAASQYVDDCKPGASPILLFQNQSFSPLSTSHKLVSRENVKIENQLESLLPFHFIPGEKGGSFVEQCRVQKDSALARKLLKRTEEHGHSPFGLHLLGTALHAYADTWAHDGFSALLSGTNTVKDLTPRLRSDQILHRLRRGDRWGKHLRNILKWSIRGFLRNTLTVGHFEASRRPDIAWMRWTYRNDKNEFIERNNPEIFLEAAEKIFEFLSLYLRRHRRFKDRFVQPRRWGEIAGRIRSLLLTGRETQEEDGLKRLKIWIARLGDGSFGFYDTVNYNQSEWISEAVSQGKSIKALTGFTVGDWVLFQQAARFQQEFVLREFCNGLFWPLSKTEGSSTAIGRPAPQKAV